MFAIRLLQLLLVGANFSERRPQSLDYSALRSQVRINEGEVFLLPSRIPHSPQRPEEGSLGLVVERRREEDELDGLRWYTDFETCDSGVLWERFFHCGDLGRDLVPVVMAYKASEACRTGKPTPGDGVVSGREARNALESDGRRAPRSSSCMAPLRVCSSLVARETQRSRGCAVRLLLTSGARARRWRARLWCKTSLLWCRTPST